MKLFELEFLAWARIPSFRQKFSCLSENGSESILLPMLFSLEREYPHLGENLFLAWVKSFSLERKPTREHPSFFTKNSLRRYLQSESFLHTSLGRDSLA